MAEELFSFTLADEAALKEGDRLGDTGLQSAEHLKAMYTYCAFQATLERDEGVRPMTIASATGGNRAVRVSGPRTLYFLHWEAKRRGSLPSLPSPEPPSSNMVLLTAKITSNGVEILEDLRTPEYTVSGEYVFLLLSNKWIEDGIQMPLLPWTTLTREVSAGVVPIGSSTEEKPQTVLGTAHFKTGMY